MEKKMFSVSRNGESRRRQKKRKIRVEMKKGKNRNKGIEKTVSKRRNI